MTQGDQLDVMEALYELYFQQRDYDSAIPLVLKLIKIDKDYKEDLANLYSRTEKYDEAIQVLDELDESLGESDYRDALRTQIYRRTGNSSGQIDRLEQKVENNPKKEQDYLNLIYLYSEEGNTTKAFETAKELLKNNPKSDLVHLALNKFYLEDGATKDALKSMRRIFASNRIDKQNKYKVLGDFIEFVNMNPDYESNLSEMISLFANENDGRVYEKLGDYYVTKGRKEEALRLYEEGIAKDPDNFSLLKNTLLLQIDFEKYSEASQLSSNALEIFPAQSIIYLLNGVANNGLQQSDRAIESLETGVDYLLEDAKQERDFYRQLSIAYSQKGNIDKANLYTKKALAIKDTN
jgi:tetratricopeptide (TPR) repeat protein